MAIFTNTNHHTQSNIRTAPHPTPQWYPELSIDNNAIELEKSGENFLLLFPEVYKCIHNQNLAINKSRIEVIATVKSKEQSEIIFCIEDLIVQLQKIFLIKHIQPSLLVPIYLLKSVLFFSWESV